jgi:hypothetical protein
MSSSDGIVMAFAFTGAVDFKTAAAGFGAGISVLATGLAAGEGFSFLALLDVNLLVAIGLHLRWFRH